jgi:hypothetical protein
MALAQRKVPVLYEIMINLSVTRKVVTLKRNPTAIFQLHTENAVAK